MNETTTYESDTLDLTLYRTYGYVNEALLEQVIALNPEISEYGTVFPLGVTIKLPDVPIQREIPTIHLWE